MSFFQIVSAFRLYSADVLLLAFGVTLLTSLLKKTVMKSCDRKIFVFLPFGIGLLVYAAFRMLAEWSVAPLTAEIFLTFEGGFGCGCAATLYYVVYEQFLRERKTEANPLLPLLAFVPEDRRREAADALYRGSKDLAEADMVGYFMETLNTYSDPPMSEEELYAAAQLLAEYLLSLEKK